MNNPRSVATRDGSTLSFERVGALWFRFSASIEGKTWESGGAGEGRPRTLRDRRCRLLSIDVDDSRAKGGPEGMIIDVRNLWDAMSPEGYENFPKGHRIWTTGDPADEWTAETRAATLRTIA